MEGPDRETGQPTGNNVTTLDELVDRISVAARIGGATELDIVTLRLHVLERLKPDTLQQAMRVKRLEKSMYPTMDSGERCEAIRQVMGISERRFYELKKIATAIPDRSDND
jgi:hypothetical protein